MSLNQKGNNKQANKIIYNVPKKCGQVHHVFQQIFSEIGQMNYNSWTLTKKTHVVDPFELAINGCKPNGNKKKKQFINIIRKCG
jgi:uncharacterized phage-associated protein